jgi:hypothetical protein
VPSWCFSPLSRLHDGAHAAEPGDVAFARHTRVALVVPERAWFTYGRRRPHPWKGAASGFAAPRDGRCSDSSDSAASGCAKRCPRTAPLPRSRRLPLRSWSSSVPLANEPIDLAPAQPAEASAVSCYPRLALPRRRRRRYCGGRKGGPAVRSARERALRRESPDDRVGQVSRSSLLRRRGFRPVWVRSAIRRRVGIGSVPGRRRRNGFA